MVWPFVILHSFFFTINVNYVHKSMNKSLKKGELNDPRAVFYSFDHYALVIHHGNVMLMQSHLPSHTKNAYLRWLIKHVH